MTPSIEQLKWRHKLITTLLENLDNEVQYEMKVQTVMVNNSTNISYSSNHLSLSTKKNPTTYDDYNPGVFFFFNEAKAKTNL